MPKSRPVQPGGILLVARKKTNPQPRRADKAPDLAMAPLPPIDFLEFSQRHLAVLQLKFRDRLVFLEFGVPGRSR